MKYIPLRPPAYSECILRGHRHQLLRWGEPVGQPWLLLHGWGDCGETFQFLVDAWSRDRYCVALDWRGFGGSDWSGPGYWFPDYLADLDALLEQLSPSAPVVLVGHSMGGHIAALYAGVRPERVARFVNLEGIGLARTAAADAPGRYRRWLDEWRSTSAPAFSVYDSIDTFAAVLRRRNPRLGASEADFVARHWLKPCEGGFTLRWDPAHKRLNPVLYSRESAEACWAAVTAPTLLLLGGVSDIPPKLGSDGHPAALARFGAATRVEVIEQAGHMMHHEVPAELATRIEAFLDPADAS